MLILSMLCSAECVALNTVFVLKHLPLPIMSRSLSRRGYPRRGQARRALPCGRRELRLVDSRMVRMLRLCGQLRCGSDPWYHDVLVVQCDMDDVVAVVAGLAADEFNRVSTHARMRARGERVRLLREILRLWFHPEPSPRRRRHDGGQERYAPARDASPRRRHGGRHRERSRVRPTPVRAVRMTEVPPDGVLMLRDEFTGEVLTSSIGNVAFLLGFQRMRPDEQVATITQDPSALVECVN